MFNGAAPQKSVLNNLIKAAKEQPNKIEWFIEGLTGLVKCATNDKSYSDEDIKKNRDVCRTCEHSTKKDGKLTSSSQCMAPNPEKGGAPCGCNVSCKSQTGKCPLEKWTHLTINKT